MKNKTLAQVNLVLLGCCIGLLGGFGAVIFRKLISCIHNLAFLQQISFSYNANLHTPIISVPIMVIFIPIIGAILVVFLIENFALEAKGPGVSETIYAIFYRKGIIRPIVAIIKALASAISIGTGGSVGREGPIIQIGSAFGAMVGQLLQISPTQRIILIAAGGAAGIAATFNTPIGGLAFAIELLLVSINALSVCVVAASVVIATFIGYIFFGSDPMFISVNTIPVNDYHKYPMLLLLIIPFGIMIGIVSTVFVKGLYWVEDIFTRLFRNPYLRHMLGMGIIGCMLYIYMFYLGHYYIEGVGYATIEDALQQLLNSPWIFLILLVGKLIATCITLGSGGSGGIFSPSLFFGASAGAAYGIFIAKILPSLGISPIVFIIAGMAGVVGSSTGAIVTAIVMTFEMTRDYMDILPILVTVSLAYAIRSYFSEENIYTLKFYKRGFILPKGLESRFITVKKAHDIMNKDFKISTLQQIKAYDLQHARNANKYFIIYEAENVCGIVGTETTTRTAPFQNDTLNTNIYWVESNAEWSQIIITIKNVQNPVVLVTTCNSSKLANDIIGVITTQEITSTLQEQAVLVAPYC